jgi:hypothetical protein
MGVKSTSKSKTMKKQLEISDKRKPKNKTKKNKPVANFIIEEDEEVIPELHNKFEETSLDDVNEYDINADKKRSDESSDISI